MALTQQSAGWQDIPNSAPMLGNDQIGQAARYAEQIATIAADTASDLPASGNWLGRTIWVTAENCGYVSNGTAWRRHPMLDGVYADADGGGNLTTAWAVSAAPAQLALGVGVWAVAASIGFSLSPGATVNIQAHLFDSAGNAIGNGQQSYRYVPQAGTQSFTAEFTRVAVLTAPATLQIRSRTSATGGTQGSGAEHLIAWRIG